MDTLEMPLLCCRSSWCTGVQAEAGEITFEFPFESSIECRFGFQTNRVTSPPPPATIVEAEYLEIIATRT
jgi:hypothetical protein